MGVELEKFPRILEHPLSPGSILHGDNARTKKADQINWCGFEYGVLVFTIVMCDLWRVVSNNYSVSA